MTIDIDVPGSWPRDVANRVQTLAEEFGGETRFCSDVAIPGPAEESFRDLLHSHRLRAYHATRLLAHEKERVRREGLRPLSLDLVEDRLREAVDLGVIRAETAALLSREHVYGKGADPNRGGQICLFLGEYALQTEVSLVRPLLTYWGGEAMFKSAGEGARTLLAELGSPTIVIVRLDTTGDGHLYFPSLAKLFVGAFLQLGRVGCDVLYRSEIPASHIERVSGPGDPWYDKYTKLPR